MRFGNGIFEPVWNNAYVDHVQITMAETIGIGSRGRYYEQAGALRDMMQNHMLQLLCLVAMEPPVDLDPDSIHDEKVKVLKSIVPIGRRRWPRRPSGASTRAGSWMEWMSRGIAQEPDVEPAVRHGNFCGPASPS